MLPDILKNILIESQNSEVQNTTSEVVVSPLAVGVLNGAKPLTQVILNPIIGVLVDK